MFNADWWQEPRPTLPSSQSAPKSDTRNGRSFLTEAWQRTQRGVNSSPACMTGALRCSLECLPPGGAGQERLVPLDCRLTTNVRGSRIMAALHVISNPKTLKVGAHKRRSPQLADRREPVSQWPRWVA